MQIFSDVFFSAPRTAAALAVMVLLAGWQGTGHAQTATNTPSAAPEAGTLLPQVTVSASGLQLGSDDMATPVSVLEGDELVLRREGTLGETLAKEPGMQSSHFGAGASRPVIRGMDGPRVQVLSDGVEVQDASTVSPDHAVASEPLLARQIEVLRGPSALIHGGGPWVGWSTCWTTKFPPPFHKKATKAVLKCAWARVRVKKPGLSS